MDKLCGDTGGGVGQQLNLDSWSWSSTQIISKHVFEVVFTHYVMRQPFFVIKPNLVQTNYSKSFQETLLGLLFRVGLKHRNTMNNLAQMNILGQDPDTNTLLVPEVVDGTSAHPIERSNGQIERSSDRPFERSSDRAIERQSRL